MKSLEENEANRFVFALTSGKIKVSENGIEW